MAQIRNRLDIKNSIADENIAIRKLPNFFNDNDEMSLTTGLLWSLGVHGALVLCVMILSALGLVFPKFALPELPNRDIEFKLVQNESKPPINKNTKIRSDRDSQAGGKHNPKLPVSEPSPKAQAPAPKKQATAQQPQQKPQKAIAQKPAPQKAQPKQPPKQPQQVVQKPQPAKPQPQKTAAQTPAPAKPTPIKAPAAPNPTAKPTSAPAGVAKPSAPKIATAPKSPFAVPTSKTSAPAGATYKPAGAPSGAAGGSAKGAAGSGSSAPAPKFSTGGGGANTGGSAGSSGSKYASRGTTGGYGSGGNPSPGNPNGAPGIDAIKQPNWGPYMRDLEQRIKRNWSPPKGDSSKRVVITFTIGRDGRLLSRRITKSSGVPLADTAAMKAIELTAPFRPLPPEFKGQSVPIEFTFDYNVLNSALR